MAIRAKWKFPGVTKLGPFSCLWWRWLCGKFRIHKQHCQTNNFQFAQIRLDQPSNPRHLASIQYLQRQYRLSKYCNVLFWDIADWLWQSFLNDRHASANKHSNRFLPVLPDLSAAVYHHGISICSERDLQDLPKEMHLFSRRLELGWNFTNIFFLSSSGVLCHKIEKGSQKHYKGQGKPFCLCEFWRGHLLEPRRECRFSHRCFHRNCEATAHDPF